ncbi:hypothetical protein KSB_69430 [Ktedonobacter robiniae]|uniref:Uncharacterized protein n=1 Tax=Ktedonobacter robiniae TaxID=2778365 RepID=A0ABQ3V0C3_9CHLR|nr:hypothetical protein KSB_69430 [Ktedonobacter robiniae]
MQRFPEHRSTDHDIKRKHIKGSERTHGANRSNLPFHNEHNIRSQTSTDREIVALPLGAEYLMLITPSDEGEREASAMENFFQACALDEAFGLELVGTRREQGFVLRVLGGTIPLAQQTIRGPVSPGRTLADRAHSRSAPPP